jgi:hypothetical protein
MAPAFMCAKLARETGMAKKQVRDKRARYSLEKLFPPETNSLKESIEYAINQLQSIVKSWPPNVVCQWMRGNYEEGEYDHLLVSSYRDETDEEEARREAREKEEILRNKETNRQLYEKLKKVFEPEDQDWEPLR